MKPETHSGERIFSPRSSVMVTHHMLQGMGINGDDPNGCSPLMVLFVVVLVKAGVVEESEKKTKGK